MTEVELTVELDKHENTGVQVTVVLMPFSVMSAKLLVMSPGQLTVVLLIAWQMKFRMDTLKKLPKQPD